LNGELSFFESHWKPESWASPYRFIFIRKQVRCQDKAPIQLDLFKPIEYGYEFKVIVTNKCTIPRKVVAFHEGRGSQEGIFAELKSHCQMDYVPVTTQVGNQLYMFAGILAHNLTRELQIQLTPRARGTTAKRAALWCFREIETLRRTVIQRAGRIIRPAGKLILSMNNNDKLENELMHSLELLKTLRA
jgi:Transposase DDE domain group 1